jgi:Mrp family chromosome partitioning ATPase/capsular polysaccharide biosynthesis protein
LDNEPAEGTRPHLVAAAVRRYALLIATVVVLATVGTAILAFQLPASYTATASVLPQPALGNPLSPSTSATNAAQFAVAMETEANLVDTPAVATLASQTLGKTSPGPSDTVAASVAPNTQIVQISYTSPTAASAKAGAQAFATAFLAYRKGVATDARDQTLSSLESQERKTSAALQTATSTAAKAPKGRSFATQQVELYANRLAALDETIGETRATSVDPGTVVTAALLPAAASGLTPTPLIAAGCLAGLVIGLLLAVWLEWRDDLVYASSVLDIGGTMLLADVPAQADGPQLLQVHSDNSDSVHEAYRRLCLALTVKAPAPQVISVSPVSPDQSASLVATNLSLALFEAGHRVTLVAADLADRGVEELLGARIENGLAELLNHKVKLSGGFQIMKGIGVISGGHASGSSRDLFSGPRLGQLLTMLRQGCDYVVIASPAISSADAETLARSSDGVLLVIGDSHTTRSGVAAAAARLNQLNVRTVGAVSIPKSSGVSRPEPPVRPQPVAVPEVVAPPTPRAAIEAAPHHEERRTKRSPRPRAIGTRLLGTVKSVAPRHAHEDVDAPDAATARAKPDAAPAEDPLAHALAHAKAMREQYIEGIVTGHDAQRPVLERSSTGHVPEIESSPPPDSHVPASN